ncbi:ribonuclease R [Rufibacter sediminis]|uniref:Ribonuclease R n=1 Tax=Rufibacter sediminis TaxID=2762756 RepID=A0ABR6VQQ7_9BACT|nr:ribonuclease R [Rufibacter sediminis]MBC3539504.1 ribonuclease R [Rufibacter sediminis]
MERKRRGPGAGRDSAPRSGNTRKEKGAPRQERGGASGRRSGRGQNAGEVSREVLLNVFSQEPKKVFSYRQLHRRLGVTDKEGREEVSGLLKKMSKGGELIFLPDDSYILNPEFKGRTERSFDRPERSSRRGEDRGPAVSRRGGPTIIGKVDLANGRHAYVVSEESEQDIRVPVERLMFAMDGDTVKVQLRRSRRANERPEGEVVEVIQRQREEIVGRLEMSKGYGFIVPDQKRMYFDVFVGERGLADAKHGDKVLVKVTDWPEDPEKKPTGEIIRVFGPAGEHNAEIHAIMAEFGLPFEFPESVENEANAIPEEITREEIAKRRDFRDITTFTIDPADAKDFDDALSVRQLENGNWEIGVHIADVTHYVQPNSRLEKEAYRRATSVYLVDRTIPMLPERLSNGLCSLRPNEDKLTFSVVFEIDESAKIHHYWVGRTIIHSDRRFAYEDAQQVIETGEGDFATEILKLNELAKKFKEKRFQNGAVNFETIEVKFKLDENGKPLHLYVKERKDAHKLIEEFMLLANKYVAEHVYKLKKGDKKLTMVYRTHGAPDPEKLINFSLFARKFGYKVDLAEGQDISKELNKLAGQTEGKPEQNVLQSLAIRTMAKAKYSTEAEGHFGLAFAHYSHFTSPIRRYPDMMAHRLIDQYARKDFTAEKEEFEERSLHSSDMEKRAADAERASIKFKQVEYISGFIGQQFKGIVSGLTEWGMYVEIEENKCEGMVRLADLQDDFYELDAANYRIIGQNNKRIISFGDEVIVEVKAANVLERTIDLTLVDTVKK